MQHIPLSEITVVFICPDHNEKYKARRKHMEELCKRLQFRKVIHWKSGTEAFPNCVSRATIDIFTQYPDEPILLLEDDVDIEDWVSPNTEIIVPEGTDAIYLGLSKCAGSQTRNLHDGPSQFFKKDDSSQIPSSLVRVKNMLSVHAVFYISSTYKQAIVKLLSKSLSESDVPYYNDVLISRIQKDYQIYAMKTPPFYQADRFNHPYSLEKVTRFIIKN